MREQVWVTGAPHLLVSSLQMQCSSRRIAFSAGSTLAAVTERMRPGVPALTRAVSRARNGA